MLMSEKHSISLYGKIFSHMPIVNASFFFFFFVTEWEMTTKILYSQSTFIFSQEINVSWNWTWEKQN